MEQLYLYNFPSGKEIQSKYKTDHFVLSTCQRTIVAGIKDQNSTTIPQAGSDFIYLEGKTAYAFILEVICGLQSKLIGENEIVGQFRNAYKSFAKNNERCTKLLTVIEKILKDSKEIRTRYLLGLSQKTYSSIARKKILAHRKVKNILILGSGQLAEDVINQFKKKTNVYITARNSDKAKELAQKHDISIVSWSNKGTWVDFPYIVNTIGFKGELLTPANFFNQWDERNVSNESLFIDLGSPTCITPNISSKFLGLDGIFKEGAIHESYKKEKINMAKVALEDLVTRREQFFMKQSSFNGNNIYV